ncbi:lactate dehydrogenase [Clostridium sp. MCC353]|uniref:D-isomer specific 2-hydroxyacid dehydrogenase family protein n=1 Tax=Clostridium sp. MCC353 TaxID=2592646 RepID=UPI001C0254E1|nr:D-isomer specific 2-hydroxyacid dehydrogenase family protein [Clostridium sp. MCC353]MBT9776755.1 lactate dehydrogenase [Clostridium sp. MCC353]
MKLIAFEVRDDEMGTFKQLEKEHDLEITYYPFPVSTENIDLADGFEYMTTLGMSHLDSELLDLLYQKGIRFLNTRTIGYNHIDIKHANELGMVISNTYYGPYGVADYTIMLILMSLRHYKQALFRGNVNDYSLTGLQGMEMRNLTVGVIGTGKIGAAVIENLQGFRCKVLAYDVYENPSVQGLAEYVSLEELYNRCDIITLHTPLLESTYHMINKDTIKQMKDGVIIINCARGPLICLEDLINAVESKKVGAVGLDVVENEEGIYHRDLRSDIIRNRDMAYLRQFPNVTMTQHMAFYTKEAVESMVVYSIKNLMQCAKTGTCDMALK